MGKTKIEKIASIEEQIAQLEAEKKKLRQQHKVQENKARTKRLCSRHGLLEKHMPALVSITDEQFETFIKKGIDTSYGRNILANITGQTAAKSQTESVVVVAQPIPATAAKPAETAQQSGTGKGADEGNSARVSG